MRISQYLERVPREALLLAAPVIVFAVSFGLRATFASSSDAPTEQAVVALPSLHISVSQPQLLPTPIPDADTEAVATNDDRTDCAEIYGTDYRSPTEREWYLANCTDGGATQATTGSTGSTGAVAGTISGPPPPVGGGQAPIGDRLVIPSIGVNADVWRATVSGGGQMPDPTGYFNVLEYDFSAFAGLGGDVNSGNMVMAGHVDCARCHDGSPGLAVFYYIRNLSTGDQIQYYTSSGAVVNYVVTGGGDYPPNTNWSSIVASGTADLTLITCTGTWNAAAHEYSHRHVVFAKKA